MPTPFSLMWNNTENFYDTVNDPAIMDDEFTPEGHYHWTQKRFDKKVHKLTKVIKDIVKPNSPDIIGLAEIENKTVMMAIVDELHKQGMTSYSFIHYDSPDERGSDVAMIYNTKSFNILKSIPIKISLAGIEDRTRDILYVKGNTINDEILHLFFTHFPSRCEGMERSERRRYFVASELRNAVYKKLSQDQYANVIIMGDFNDTPDDHSITEVLGAQKSFENLQPLNVYNLLYPRHQKGLGSTYHKGWLLFDQILVSGNLLISQSIECKPEFADIFNPRYLLYFNKQGVVKPDRTYSGKYVGGYSDHLPVFLKLNLRQQK